jgi:DNA-binding XRE family transcriptional regulator
MRARQVCDLPKVRRILDKSQSELAALLGVSVRAIQSYEQGWRPTPPTIQKMGWLLLFLDWRKTHRRWEPCWDICGCESDIRAECPAHIFRAGDICWLISGTMCRGIRQGSWEKKATKCRQCAVVKRWLVPGK